MITRNMAWEGAPSIAYSLGPRILKLLRVLINVKGSSPQVIPISLPLKKRKII